MGHACTSCWAVAGAGLAEAARRGLRPPAPRELQAPLLPARLLWRGPDCDRRAPAPDRVRTIPLQTVTAPGPRPDPSTTLLIGCEPQLRDGCSAQQHSSA